jgi:hypothetical protein
MFNYRYTFMKWVCNYCLKVVEKENFIEVLEEGMEDGTELRTTDSKIESFLSPLF